MVLVGQLSGANVFKNRLSGIGRERVWVWMMSGSSCFWVCSAWLGGAVFIVVWPKLICGVLLGGGDAFPYINQRFIRPTMRITGMGVAKAFILIG